MNKLRKRIAQNTFMAKATILPFKGETAVIKIESLNNIILELESEYENKCMPETNCNCSECKWYAKWFKKFVSPKESE